MTSSRVLVVLTNVASILVVRIPSSPLMMFGKKPTNIALAPTALIMRFLPSYFMVNGKKPKRFNELNFKEVPKQSNDESDPTFMTVVDTWNHSDFM
ncbi:hypothetical protein Peur_000856 [Populus x canadensis]